MSVGFISLSQRQRNYPCSGNTHLTCSKEGHGHCIRREGDGFSFRGCKMHCVYWLSSKEPHYQQKVLCWHTEVVANGYQNQTLGETDERRFSCIKSILQKTSPCFKWLLCLTVALNWLISLLILLNWRHLIILCSPTWKNTFLGTGVAEMTVAYLLLVTFYV